MSDVIWLTQEAYDTLTGELAERTGPGRKEITARIEAAREEGDLRENGGYHAAREDQGKNEARIRQLQAMLLKAQIGAPASEPDEVAHGKVIKVLFVPLDLEQEFLLASREEKREGLDVFSTASPLGAAVLGKRVGDSATYTLPNGKPMTVRVLAVGPDPI